MNNSRIGKLLPGVKVIIANPDTKGHCGDSHLGEIWVQSPHTANGYFTIYGDETDYNDHFNAKLVTGSTTEMYARTGYLGFLRRTECSQAGSILDETTPSIASRDSDTESLHSQGTIQTHQSAQGVISSTGVGSDQELHDAVYVVGALDEVITLRGMNYHPIDIENSVLRCHKKIAECAVFTWTNLLVVVVELDGNESEALDLVPLVTNTVREGLRSALTHFGANLRWHFYVSYGQILCSKLINESNAKIDNWIRALLASNSFNWLRLDSVIFGCLPTVFEASQWQPVVPGRSHNTSDVVP